MKVENRVNKEREAQIKKWGIQNHNAIEWIGIITEEVGEAAKEAVDYHFNNPSDLDEKVVQEQRFNNLITELIQVAAVTMQAVESLGRNKKKNYDKRTKRVIRV